MRPIETATVRPRSALATRLLATRLLATGLLAGLGACAGPAPRSGEAPPPPAPLADAAAPRPSTPSPAPSPGIALEGPSSADAEDLAPSPAARALALERILRDPEWLGRPPLAARWSADGTSVVFERERAGAEPGRETVVADLATGAERVLGDGEATTADPRAGDWSRDRTRRVQAIDGDLWLVDVARGTRTQLTRTVAAERAPRFLADDASVVFERAGTLYVRELATGLERQPAELRTEDEPEPEGAAALGTDATAEREERGATARREGGATARREGGATAQREGGATAQREGGATGERAGGRGERARGKQERERDWLAAQQARLFEHVRRTAAEREARRARERAERASDPHRVPPPFWLGDGTEVRRQSLSPDGRHLLVVLGRDGGRGKRDSMPVWITEESYVETRAVRPKVGVERPSRDRLLLLDLERHEKHEIDLGALPGAGEDPLAFLRARRERGTAGATGADTGSANDSTDSTGSTGSTESIGSSGSSDATGSRDATEATGAAETEADAKDASDADAGEADTSDADGDAESDGKARPLRVTRIEWNEAGDRVAVQVTASDRKDRWIARLDLATRALETVERLHDEAWVLAGRFGQLGWLADDASLWFLSERSGYAHLFAQAPGAEPRALTAGEFEVSDVELAPDGSWFLVRANATHPGVHELWRLPLAGTAAGGSDVETEWVQGDLQAGALERLTRFEGRSAGTLSPDGTRLLVTTSTALRPDDLFVQAARPGAEPRRLTSSASAELRALPLQEPRFVEIPGEAGPIHARLYRPPSGAASDGEPTSSSGEARTGAEDTPRAGAEPLRPAVLFVHGAGYLQNAHKGWSSYFREFLFHQLLAHLGYVVLDMDYRASAGYGRDWRTAIYRDMGTPELADLAAGVDWLVAHERVDRRRVGVYGGSYGGFLTLMALFRRPELFACGAALRPVTDWAHYNAGYTSNILNVPDLDPEAYARSSPIEHAEGLAAPLLICHGMLDDNVLFLDTVRLAQRLIELEKTDWEVAMYPVEPHAFEEPASWLDEYRRILKLFETHLR